MVADQLRARGIRDERVLEAMAAIPRERFVPDGPRVGARTPTRRCPIDAGQTISQPYIVARMTELLDVRAGRPDPRDRHRLGLPGGGPGARSAPT